MCALTRDCGSVAFTGVPNLQDSSRHKATTANTIQKETCSAVINTKDLGNRPTLAKIEVTTAVVGAMMIRTYFVK